MKSTRHTSIRVFESFTEENAAEHKRLAMLTPEERMQEFTHIQKRIWGEKWPNIKMKKVATWEPVDW